MRKLLTIGELAGLFNINSTKIRFYEKKGLLEPKEVSESGYRLYSFEDLEWLEVILLLRDLDVPLEKIKELKKGYYTSDYRDLLVNLKKETKQQIRKLKQKLTTLNEHLIYLDDYDPNIYKIHEYPDRYYVQIEENIDGNTTEKEFYDSHYKYQLRLSNYEDKYIYKFNDNFTMDIGVISKNKSLYNLKKVRVPAGKYLEVKSEVNLLYNLKGIAKQILKNLEKTAYEVDGPLLGLEDFRLFLFSNKVRFYTFEIRLKD